MEDAYVGTAKNESARYKKQWEYVTALPKDENGLTNSYEGITFEEYETTVVPELMMHENSVGMPE